MRTQLEEELAWRQEELFFLKNQLNYIDVAHQDKYRKSLILMLYAHFEGFTKIALQTYIQYLNDLEIKVNQTNYSLQASHLHKEFTAYDNLDRKNRYFKRALPEDTKLHRFFRRVEFVESFDEFRDVDLFLPDEIVDTESNLWYIVLQKNLYKLGLPIDLFEEQSRDINALVNRRNEIGHGSFRAGISEGEYNQWERRTYNVMSQINMTIYDYAVNEKYLCSGEG